MKKSEIAIDLIIAHHLLNDFIQGIGEIEDLEWIQGCCVKIIDSIDAEHRRNKANEEAY